MTGNAAGVDNTAAPLSSHDRRRMLHAEHRPTEHQCEYVVEFFNGHLGDTMTGIGGAGVVEQAIEPAEFADGTINDVDNRGQAGRRWPTQRTVAGRRSRPSRLRR